MIPVFIPVAVGPPDLPVRVQQLERALTVTLNLLQVVVERLESKMGPGFLGADLERLAVGASQAREQAAQIDALVRQGQQPKAARLVREWAGVPWDQAHTLIGRWDSYPPEQRVRWLQLAGWIKAAGAQDPAGVVEQEP
jgi:hypothetical protein